MKNFAVLTTIILLYSFTISTTRIGLNPKSNDTIFSSTKEKPKSLLPAKIEINTSKKQKCNQNYKFTNGKNGTKYRSKRIYVSIRPEKSKDLVKYMELYLNNQLIRRDTQSPFEWGRYNTNTDPALQNLTLGSYRIKIRIKDTCGKYKDLNSNVQVL